MELYHVYSLFVNFGILYAVNAQEHRIPTSPHTVPETGWDLRLAMDQIQSLTSGRIEVLSGSGRYHPLCADKWSINEASAACRQLGFRSGALAATKQRSSGNWQRSDLLTSQATCNEHAQSLRDCELIISSRCRTGHAAAVICQENKGCPVGWIAGPTSCYLIQDSVTRREFAVKKCTSAGGHLVKIETEAENHFISHAFRNENQGLILTGGVKVDGRWLWETVDNTAFKTDRECISYVKWFPGWQPGNVSSQPTNNKKDRCLFLSSLIEQPNGSYVNVDYHFWLSEQCSFDTTKKQSSGFKCICEMAQSRNKEVGCYTGIGVGYRGPANVTRTNKRCLNWTNATEINPNTYPKTGLGDHNYCRNPDYDEAPWCWVFPGTFEFCDIPVCNITEEHPLDACGKRPLESNQVMSRFTAAYGMYPWQVAIRRRQFISPSFHSHQRQFISPSFHSHHCGGTIIGEYWILSAAHCFGPWNESQIIILTGDHCNDLTDEYEQEFEVEIVIMHERYNSSAHDNDIALIKVQPINGRGIVFNDYVQPACLPDENVVYKSDQGCLISGWGKHGETESPSICLNAARVPIMDQATCNKLYKWYNQITDNMVCAGNIADGINACDGDSGGPLVCNVTGKYVVMGVSFGIPCTWTNNPGLYTNVSAYVPWIKHKLEQFG